MARKTNESLSQDIAVLKTMIEGMEEDIRELKEKMIGNGREGLLSRVSRLETTMKVMAFVLSVGLSLLVAVLKL